MIAFKKIILICFLLSVFHFFCKDNLTSPQEVSFQITDYFLPGYYTTSIVFDSQGTAWIGTFKQGLIKYDGTATFYNSTNSLLPDSIVIRDLASDDQDNIWIGSDSGLIKFDHNQFTVYNTYNSPIAEDIVWSVAVDFDNMVWLASCRYQQGGLMTYDGTDWTLYNPQNSQLPSNSVSDIIVDGNNNKWIAISGAAQNNCIIKIAGENWTLFNEQQIGFAPYNFGNLALNKSNHLYVSVDYMLSSLWDMTRPQIIQYNGTNWSINNPVDSDGEPLGYVGKINVDLEGYIWASLSGRQGCVLVMYNGKQWIYNSSDFPVESVSAIEADLSNNIWLATGDGIYIVKY